MTRNPTALLVDDPLWYKDAVIYQIHVKSFCDSNNDGVGDFAGLISKLDYIAELGVDAIWLLPFYPSPRRDDGYDIAEYRGVHPDYGTMADVRRFITEAHARGLRVITELVINHTSDQHPWFQRARRAKPGSALRDFYVWSDHDKKYAGTRIIFIDTEPSNWTWDPAAKAYYWHRFYSHQPDLNFDNPRVLKAVVGVMKFWLNLGVDGLRLDAVPYLVEREGTANENLPETHEVLRKLRAAMDADFKNRLLLAEANQWPEDTQEYFGRGDECHMAFHFPLMPRMYMAIAREDRFPITDIMRQTPEVPNACQWAIFLRNHDELTLEMVTDAERDYLWEVYASDRRARLNLGIRRRLAPLLERDRRRVELMNSLLFSMPGTPVMYYGDEIGMGDNIHLGDRDGVRTPMQWSPDRNGGFSRADPEQLVLPAIMGSLYGYESVNVEAQTRDAHSLLNWTRRMLATRRRHRVFGRGRIHFLQPANRKILAYIRALEGSSDEHPPILCVVNLSRASQAVELDLSSYAQRVPVELIGGTAFPPIGQLPYLLTLQPYAFFWLELRENEPGPSWAQPAAEQLPEFTTLVLRAGLDALADTRQREAHRQLVEREILPTYLPRRRWFASQDSVLRSAHFAWGAAVPVDASSTNRPLAGATRPEVFFNEVVATLGDPDGVERVERYLLPLSIAWESTTLPALPVQLALARVRRGRHIGYLTDAFATETFARALLANLVRGTTLQSSDGTVRFEPEPGIGQAAGMVPDSDGTARSTPLILPLAPDAPVQWVAAEHAYSSLVIGEAVIVRLIRRVAAGVHPEVEMTRHLTRIGYTNTTALLGEIVHEGAGSERTTLAVIQSFVPNQGNAWTWALDYLRRTIDELAVLTEAVATGDGEVAPIAASEARTDTNEALAGYLALVGAIGTQLGELHATLALPAQDPYFGTRAATAEDVRDWTARARERVTHALDHLEVWLDARTTHAQAEWLLSQRDTLPAVIRTCAQSGLGATLSRIHGDFHLEQVLVSQGDAFLIDFGGDPAQPVETRRRKDSPLRDVASLLRSLDDVVEAMRQGSEHVAGPAQERRDQLLERFRATSAERFLQTYTEAVGGTRPINLTLLDLFLLEEAARSLGAEAASRPAWQPVSLAGLTRVAQRLLGVESESADAAGPGDQEPAP